MSVRVHGIDDATVRVCASSQHRQRRTARQSGPLRHGLVTA